MPNRRTIQQELISAPWQMAQMPKDSSVLLALSGGADSRLLLHLLAALSRRDGFSLIAAHVNHGIRGAEALRDRDFCVALCRQYGVELCVLNADVPALAKAHGRGLEEEARAVRYDYFASLMKQRNIPLLVTAHNADDNAETVLFRMARGSGLAGLGGIHPVRPFEGGTLVRPLLGMTKQAVLALCQAEQLQYVTDSTNADTAYARNRLRAEVLPVLESLFSGATERIGEMAARLSEDEAVLSALAERFLDTHCQKGTCPIKPLLAEPMPIRTRVLSKWLAARFDLTVERAHLEALLSLAQAAVPHSAVTLPNRIAITVENGALCRQDTEEHADYRLPFCEGLTLLPNGKLSISVKKVDKILKVHNLSTAPYIILKDISAIMESGLYWRPRRAGDRILMGGMHREVRKLYREAGLSLSMRANLPLLCDRDGIVWVPLAGVRDGVQADGESGLLAELLMSDE